jgi:hypothetical protein
MTSTVLLVEDDPSGHRLDYAGIVARAALQRGHRVVVALPAGAEASPEALMSVPAGVDLAMLPGGRATAAAVALTAAREGATRTFVLSADDLMGAIAARGWRGPGELSLLVMRPRSQRTGATARAITVVKTLLRTAARARGVRVRVLESAVAPRSHGRAVRDPVRFTATEEDVAAFRAAAELDSEHCWVAVVGVIASRKHVPLVASALTGLPYTGLLLAGRVEASERAAVDRAVARLERAGHPVRRLDRLLSNAEFDAAIAAADVVVVAHGNEGASGVLGKAAAAGTPLVLAGARSLAEDAARLPQLAQWVPLDRDAVRAAVGRARREALPVPVAGEAEFARTLLGPG